MEKNMETGIPWEFVTLHVFLNSSVPLLLHAGIFTPNLIYLNRRPYNISLQTHTHKKKETKNMWLPKKN